MQKVTIAIASPGDVAKEREAVRKVLNGWNDRNEAAFLHPLMWEHSSTPEAGSHPQTILNRSIVERSDLLVAILWSRLGTPTPTADSGTVEEIREFIALKGPKRAMMFFCTRDFPYSADPTDIANVKNFKAEIGTRSLYEEYHSVDDFENRLYKALDVKVPDLLAGRFPLPSDEHSNSGVKANEQRDGIPDAQKLIDFGGSLNDISDNFTTRMDEFRAIDGVGPEKYLDLAAHVYLSVATSLDNFITFASGSIDPTSKRIANDTSVELKRLAGASRSYLKKSFGDYWDDGEKLARDFAAHVQYLATIRKL